MTATQAAPRTQPIRLTSEYSKQALARAVPGSYWDQEAKAWLVEDPTPRAAVTILKLFPALAQEHPDLEVQRDRLAQDVRPFDRATPFDTPIQSARLRMCLAKR